MTTIGELYKLFLENSRISTDSRNILPGSLFFALKGDHFDGNLFANDALNNGAAYAIIDNPQVNLSDRCILVENTLHALQELAKLHRIHVRAKIIGITGSNGKTTTKELIGKVLSSTYKTITTRGNLNNHIGVPLTILSIENDTDFAVVEMGANHVHEIAELCMIAKPEFGIITNIGKAHLEGFGGYEGVVKAKSELYDYVRQNNGTLFVNRDNPLLVNLSIGIPSHCYGTSSEADCRGEIAGNTPYLYVHWSFGTLKGKIKTNLIGDYNFENIMAAICIGLHFGVEPGTINRAIASYIPDNNRSQWLKTGNNTVILDAYNANPSSMKAAMSNFHQIEAPDKMLILGDMMELGEHSLEEHGNIVHMLNDLDIKNVILIGDLFFQADQQKFALHFNDHAEAEQWLSKNPVKNKTILIKGSRKMQLESLVKFL